MNTKQIECMVMVAEKKNFTKAAKALYISQPSLSLLVSKLEDELGVELFDRNSTPIRLTFAGEEFYDTAKQLLSLERNITNKLRDISEQRRGRIRIGTTNFRMAYLFPMLLASLQRLFPNIILEEREANGPQLAEWLKDGTIDMAIHPVYKNVPSPFGDAFHIQLIHNESLLVVGNHKLLGNDCLIQGFSDRMDVVKISKLPMILPSSVHYLHEVIMQIFREYKVTPNIIHETDSSMAAFSLASAGEGITIAPDVIRQIVRSPEETCSYYIGVGAETWQLAAFTRKEEYFGKLEESIIATIRTHSLQVDQSIVNQ